MRAESFIQESAVKELADKLPTLKRTDYDAIDRLMKRIGIKHSLSSRKLHTMFVSKYGHSPDHWVKKIKQRNEDSVNEANPNQQAALYNPNGKTYRGAYNKMPTLDNPNDIYNRSKPQSLDALGDEEVDEPNSDESLKRFIKSKMDLLEPYEQKVLYARYWHDNTLVQCAKIFGVSPERIRQVEARALRRLKKDTLNTNLDAAKPYTGVFNEGVETPENEKQVLDFIDWAIETLHIKDPHPKFNFSRDTTAAQKDHRTGLHTSDGSITIYIENRNLVDIFRTIFHELVHHRQDQLNMIGPDDSYPGSPVEAMADMMAGKYIKIYGKQHPEIFQ